MTRTRWNLLAALVLALALLVLFRGLFAEGFSQAAPVPALLDFTMDSIGGEPVNLTASCASCHIGDFTRCDDDEAYRASFERVLRDLRATS